MKKEKCEDCGFTGNLTEHHIPPKSERFLNSLNKYPEKERKIWLCRTCHNKTHIKDYGYEFDMNFRG